MAIDDITNCDCLSNPPPAGINTPPVNGLPSGVQVAPAPIPKQFVWQVFSGDQNTLTAKLTLRDGVTPVTPDNSFVTFNLAETQFDEHTIWVGDWASGIVVKVPNSGVVDITIPSRIMNRLRRGSYMFTIRISDKLGNGSYTALNGGMLVEYTVGGPQHSIPYAHGIFDDGHYHNVDLTKFNGMIFYLAENGMPQWLEFIDGMVWRNGSTWPP